MCGRLVSAQSSPTHPPTHPHIRTHMHTPPPPTTYVVPLQTGSPSVNMFIAPDGKVTITSTHEQLFSAPYVFAGVCFPAQSVCTEDRPLPCYPIVILITKPGSGFCVLIESLQAMHSVRLLSNLFSLVGNGCVLWPLFLCAAPARVPGGDCIVNWTLPRRARHGWQRRCGLCGE